MSDVFVSYKSEDRRRVTPLVHALQADGFSVWWDAQIGGGASWRHTIEAELNSAACVIVAWSKYSVGPAGAFVQDEATRAQQRQVYLPVIIDKVALPLGFGEAQALALTGWRGNRSDPRYIALLAAVRRHVSGNPQKSSSASPRFGADRRTVIVCATVAAAGLAGSAAWLTLKTGNRVSSGSIAVLPFENLSGDPAKSYFSDGIAEEIRNALVRLQGVTVIGRTSSEAVRNEDARSAATKLNVSHILSGSVRQSPSTIRITAELIDGATGSEQWSQNYDRSPGDVIKIQTDIAENVARALSAALSPAARTAISLGGTQNVEAQNLVLQAHPLTIEADKKSLEQARDMLYRAIQLDPAYADAYARNALLIAELEGIYATSSVQMAKGLQESLRLANTATTLAPGLETGHRALALVYTVMLRIPRALSEGKRALQLAPNDANVLRIDSNLLSLIGDFPQAIAMSRRALALDPLNSQSYSNLVGILYNARKFAEAVAESERVRRDLPALFSWPILFGDCLLGMGRLDDARRQYSAGEPDHPFRLAGEAVLATRQGDKATAHARLAQMKAIYSDAENYQYAQIHSQLGDREAAIGDLRRAWELKDPGLQFLRVDPWLDPLRRDPRFDALLREMQFPT
jgi:TolB-like protein